MSTEAREELDRIGQNIASTYTVLEEAGAEMPQTRDSNNLPETAASIRAVLYGKEQTLTEEQKAQARENIGATPPEMKVLSASEYSAMTQEELVAEYEKGIRILAICGDENLIPSAINPLGAIFNGCGYLDGYRLNSSGEIVESERSVVTGYIPYEHGHTVEIAGATNPVSTGGQYIATYDADFNLILVNYMASLVGDSGGYDTCTDDNNHIYTVNTAAFSNANNTNGFKNAKYIRVALNPFIGKKMRVRYV